MCRERLEVALALTALKAFGVVLALLRCFGDVWCLESFGLESHSSLEWP